MPKTETNIMFPGRPNYIGPTSGMFGFVHHGEICEYSHDINERLHYIVREKPKNEIATRLYNLIYLGGCPAADDYFAKRKLLTDDYYAKLKLLDDDYYAKLKPLADDYDAKRKLLADDYYAKLKLLDDDYFAKRKPLDDDYYAKRKLLADEILAYIKGLIPDCPWNGRELMFPNA